MKVSISEAARRAGVKRTTIYRKVEAGKLSKEIDDDGNPVIDLSELCRVYPSADTDSQVQQRTTRAGGGRADSSALQELVTALKADKARLTQENDRLIHDLERARLDARNDLEREREEKSRLLGMLETAQHQLADLRKPEPEPIATPAPVDAALPPATQRRGFFGRLLRAS